MIKKLGSPSLARRMLVSLACTGIDLRPALRRTRDAILRPIRHELVAATTAWREELGDEIRALQVKIQEEANARQTLFSDLRADVASARTAWREELGDEVHTQQAKIQDEARELRAQIQDEARMLRAEIQNETRGLHAKIQDEANARQRLFEIHSPFHDVAQREQRAGCQE